MKKPADLTIAEMNAALFGTSDARAITTAALIEKLLDSGDVSDHPYQTQFEAFFAALNTGHDMPLTSLAHALRTHQVIFAADNSAEHHALKRHSH